MVGLGTVFNVIGIVIGGVIGVLIGNKIEKRFQDILSLAQGLAVIFMALGGVIAEMLVIDSDGVSTQGTMMMIFSLVVGAIIGEAIRIEYQFERFGEWLKMKTNNGGDSAFVNGFVTASLTVSIGAMAVIGSINDGIYGDYSVLLTKSILDLVIIMVMASSMGKGCIFSAIPVFVLEGLMTALARLLQPFMTEVALSNLSLVGNILIFCIGINIAFDKHLKVGNLLPAIVLAVIWTFIPGLNTL